jgi:hypothetical protein
MGAFCLQRKAKVASELAIFTGTSHSILQQDLNMQWIARKSACHLLGDKN